MKVRILDTQKGVFVDAKICPVTTSDLDNISWKDDDRGRFKCFNWQQVGKDSMEEIYKLERNGLILGLIQFFHEKILLDAIEINKLEVSNENFGNGKLYDKIAGCLIAFACVFAKKSLENEEVYVFSKKATEKVYTGKYGMQKYNQYYLVSDRTNCQQLISKYLKMPIG